MGANKFSINDKNTYFDNIVKESQKSHFFRFFDVSKQKYDIPCILKAFTKEEKEAPGATPTKLFQKENPSRNSTTIGENPIERQIIPNFVKKSYDRFSICFIL